MTLNEIFLTKRNFLFFLLIIATVLHYRTAIKLVNSRLIFKLRLLDLTEQHIFLLLERSLLQFDQLDRIRQIHNFVTSQE